MTKPESPRWVRAMACALLIPLAALAFDAGATWAAEGARGWLSWPGAIGAFTAFVLFSAPAYVLLPPDRFFRYFVAVAVVGAGLSWATSASAFLLLLYGWSVAPLPLLLVYTLAARHRYPEAYGPAPRL